MTTKMSGGVVTQPARRSAISNVDRFLTLESGCMVGKIPYFPFIVELDDHSKGALTGRRCRCRSNSTEDQDINTATAGRLGAVSCDFVVNPNLSALFIS